MCDINEVVQKFLWNNESCWINVRTYRVIQQTILIDLSRIMLSAFLMPAKSFSFYLLVIIPAFSPIFAPEYVLLQSLYSRVSFFFQSSIDKQSSLFINLLLLYVKQSDHDMCHISVEIGMQQSLISWSLAIL